MGKMVSRQKFKGYCLVRAKAASGMQLGRRYIAQYMSEITVIGGPKRHQQLPISVLHGLNPHIAFLIISGEIQ